MTSMRMTIEAFELAGMLERVKIMVGGAPLTETFAGQIKADGYAPEPGGAANLAKSLLGL